MSFGVSCHSGKNMKLDELLKTAEKHLYPSQELFVSLIKQVLQHQIPLTPSALFISGMVRGSEQIGNSHSAGIHIGPMR
jgi:hypothetical protein